MIKYLACILTALLVSSCSSTNDGFTEIFNGKDLTGWTQLMGTGLTALRAVLLLVKQLRAAQTHFCVRIKNMAILS